MRHRRSIPVACALLILRILRIFAFPRLFSVRIYVSIYSFGQKYWTPIFFFHLSRILLPVLLPTGYRYYRFKARIPKVLFQFLGVESHFKRIKILPLLKKSEKCIFLNVRVTDFYFYFYFFFLE